MTREQAEQILHCAMSIGEELEISGAEIWRVEDTIRRICLAYGADRVDVFCITSSIVATMFGDFGSCTQSRRVSGLSNNFTKLSALNQLSRNVCKDLPASEAIHAELDRINDGVRYSYPAVLLTCALIAGSFTVFFGGGFRDMLVSAVLGVLLHLLETLIRRGAVNGLFTALICSFIGGLLSHLSVACGLGIHADLISIGNIMLFIPGIAFTNSLRDLFSGDTISGLIRFCESILLACIIALGFAFAGFLF